jgi:CBS domain-containing protein
MKAREVMAKPLVSATPDMTVLEMARQFVEKRVTGIPVVDKEGRLLGVVTERELFVRAKAIPFSHERAPSLAGEWIDHTRLREAYSGIQQLKAADVMTCGVWTVEGDENVEDVVIGMMERRVNCVPVLEAGRVVGMLSRQDVIQSMLMHTK